MNENNETTVEKKSIKDKIVDFARDNKSKIVKGAAIVGGTLAGAGLLGFLVNRGGDYSDYDEFDECDYEEIVEEYDSDDDDSEDSDEEDSNEDE